MTVTHLAAGGVGLERAAGAGCAGRRRAARGLPRAGGSGHPGQRGRPLRPDGEGLPPARRTLPGRHRAPAPRLAPGADLCAQPGAARDVACVGGGGRRRPDGGRQGRAGSGDGPVPPGRCAEGPHRRRRRRTGRRGPARAGGGARRVHGPGLAGQRARLRLRVRRPARPGRPGAAGGAGRRGRVPRGRHPRGHDHRRLPGHGAGHRAPGRAGRTRRRRAHRRRDRHARRRRPCASAWPPSASAPASRPSRSCASCRR